MTLNYGRPANPEAFVIAILESLGLPVGPERDPETGLPCYVVTVVAGHSDKYLLCATVSVHSFATTRAAASAAAWNADNALLSTTPWDKITLPDNSVASANVNVHTPPIWADYRDPFIKRYVGRYDAQLRFTH